MRVILVVLGTRPEAIKMCPLILKIKEERLLTVKVCVTGQHRDMIGPVLKTFGVIPDYDLEIMSDNQTMFDITSRILDKIEKVMHEVTPDLVIVHGDTTSSFVGALAAFYMKIPIAHVEAGLRSHNLYEPFPEEFNRIAISDMARFHFAPTITAKVNLLREGINENKIYLVGNTIVDALKITIRENYNHEELLWAEGSKLILMTVHRRENLGEPIKNIFKAVRYILDNCPDIKIVYPIHKNQVIRQDAYDILGEHPNLHIIEPLDVRDFHNILNKCSFVLTDSGGIQEEISYLNKIALVLRNTTERPEGIKKGCLKLVGTNTKDIISSIEELLQNNKFHKNVIFENLYGDGDTCKRIIEILKKEL